MDMRFLHTLKFQITLALSLLILALIGAIVASQYQFDELYRTEKVLQLSGKLQKASNQMSMQAMNYLAYTPDESTTYERDLKLYYQDLIAHVETFDMIDQAFMETRFSSEMTGLDEMMQSPRCPKVEKSVRKFHGAWLLWRKDLMSKLGKQASMPMLVSAAGYIDKQGQTLAEALDRLIFELEQNANDRKQQLALFNQAVLLFAVVTVLVILLWFYRRVIKPLEKVTAGMKTIALGNFHQRLKVEGADEISQMNQQFNYLGQHVDALFQLMTRLYEGGNLDEVLQFLTEEFSEILPIDWVGVLFVTGDGRIQLEKGFSEAGPESFGSIRFELEGTLLQQSMQSGQPLHIENIRARLAENDRYQFLRILIDKNCHEAIFLPLLEPGALEGVLVFASGQSSHYTQEHLLLLRNLSMLITLSFNQTVKLADYQHLAAIGRFATGIAHEIRSPLATINMALDYFRAADLPENMTRRALLASDEAERLKHLMEDILLYAKPMVIKTQRHELEPVIRLAAELLNDLYVSRGLHFEMIVPASLPKVLIDTERMQQVIMNLMQNAAQASAEGGTVMLVLSTSPINGWLEMTINNQGEMIQANMLDKVFDAFYTTRAHGTGLGLNITKRIVDAHGGQMEVESDEVRGTTFTLSLPPCREP